MSLQQYSMHDVARRDLAKRSVAKAFAGSFSPEVRHRILDLDPALIETPETNWDMIRSLAGIALRQIEADLQHEGERDKIRSKLRSFMADGAPSMVFQPIHDANDGHLRKVEALARFPSQPYRSPDKWFADADDAGIALELELQAIANALATFGPVWQTKRIPVAINASVKTIMSGALVPLLTDIDGDLVILEIAEQQEVPCYRTLTEHLAPLRSRGVRIAVDDVGTGYAGMQHVLSIKPDTVKLDISLIRNLETDPSRQAMVRSVIGFSKMIGSTTVAEGVETSEELDILREFGVDAVQGYLLGRPMPVDDIMRSITQNVAEISDGLDTAG